MFHLVIVLAVLLAAPSAMAFFSLDLNLNLKTIVELLRLTDLLNCAKADLRIQVDVFKLRELYYMYHHCVPSFCCGIAQIKIITSRNFASEYVNIGSSTFITKANCSGGQVSTEFTTAGLGFKVGPQPIGKNQLAMLNAGKTYLEVFTVLQQYNNYEYIVTETCRFAVLKNNTATFEGNTYDTYCTTPRLASLPFST